jgi:hypothetical protein
MDPYLEAHWRDVHARLILYACDQLEPQLPANLIARVEERVVVEPDEGAPRDTLIRTCVSINRIDQLRFPRAGPAR